MISQDRAVPKSDPERIQCVGVSEIQVQICPYTATAQGRRMLRTLPQAQTLPRPPNFPAYALCVCIKAASMSQREVEFEAKTPNCLAQPHK